MRHPYFTRWFSIFLWLMCCLVGGNLSCSAWAQDTSIETPPPTNSNTANSSAGNIVDDVIQQLDNKTSNNPATNTQPDTNAPAAPPPRPPGIPGIVAAGDNATLPQVPEPPKTFIDHKTVILHALDKVTARTKTLEVPVGQQFNFGALTIAVRACRARPALEPADAAAFLQIVEQKPGEPMVPRFSGWMFASAPSLSALEHPVYDVWVVGCGGAEIVKPAAQTTATPAPASPAPAAPPAATTPTK